MRMASEHEYPCAPSCMRKLVISPQAAPTTPLRCSQTTLVCKRCLKLDVAERAGWSKKMACCLSTRARWEGPRYL